MNAVTQDAPPSGPLSPVTPAYRRVKEHVLRHILAGDWGVGERIPSEHALKDQFGVSRMTVHRALRELTEEGYVSRTVGAGTFVADRRANGSIIKIRDIADEARAAGRQCRNRLIASSRGVAGAETAARLGVTPDTPLFCTTTVRWIANAPLQLEERWVNAALVPSYSTYDFERQSPAVVIGTLAPEAAEEHEVRAILPKAKIRTLLAMMPDEVCLLLTTTTKVGGAVVSVADLYHPGSRYALPGRFL